MQSGDCPANRPAQLYEYCASPNSGVCRVWKVSRRCGMRCPAGRDQTEDVLAGRTAARPRVGVLVGWRSGDGGCNWRYSTSASPRTPYRVTRVRTETAVQVEHWSVPLVQTPRRTSRATVSRPATNMSRTGRRNLQWAPPVSRATLTRAPPRSPARLGRPRSRAPSLWTCESGERGGEGWWAL